MYKICALHAAYLLWFAFKINVFCVCCIRTLYGTPPSLVCSAFPCIIVNLTLNDNPKIFHTHFANEMFIVG